MSYDGGRKAYTLYGFYSYGDSFFVRGQVEGKIWTWTEETIMDGKPVKIRATITEDTPSSYSFKLEASAGDGPMTVVEQGKATKGKSS
jgi:hypothetical protein